MRIVVLNDTFTQSMGYTENLLPEALCQLGHEVHVVAGNLQAYHSLPSYKETYEPFLGPAQQPVGSKEIGGFTLHRIRHRLVLGHVALVGLHDKLRELRPDVVQTLAAATWPSMQAAVLSRRLGFLLFTGAHQTPSVMAPQLMRSVRWRPIRLLSDLRRAVPGRFVARATEKCFAATEACADVAVRFYGVPAGQVVVCPIGSDTKRFHPVEDSDGMAARQKQRADLGYRESDIVCIYTGRFTAEKNPLCLARAVADLDGRGEPFRGLFIGDGPQTREISTQAGCTVLPFVPWHLLADFYRAADIGAWPAQESMSLLDAAACGLPAVASERMGALERIEGNGFTYKEGDAADMAATLLRLRDPTMRRTLGGAGLRKVREQYSWDRVARIRATAYELALSQQILARQC